VWYWAA